MVNFRLVLPAQPPAATPSPACSRRQRQLAGFGEHGFCVAHLFFLCSSLLQDVLGISAATLPPALFSYHVLYISSSRDVLYFLFLHLSQLSVHLLVNFKSLVWKLMGFLKNLSWITFCGSPDFCDSCCWDGASPLGQSSSGRFVLPSPASVYRTCLPLCTFCAGFGVEFSGKAGRRVFTPSHLEPDDETLHLSTGSHGLGVMETLGCMSPHAVWVKYSHFCFWSSVAERLLREPGLSGLE